jgi:hypothetical protein
MTAVRPTAPLRGTQSLVGQMGWIWDRPWLTLIEIAWRWVFGIPFLAVCGLQAQQIFTALPPESTGLDSINSQNPWVGAVQMARAWSLYEPRVHAVLLAAAPVAVVAWVIVSGLGRSLLLRRLDPELAPRLRMRPFSMMLLQAGWLALFGAIVWGWLRSMAWVTATHISAGTEPDLIGYAFWVIFLSLGFFTAWALVSWTLAIAPIIMLLEERSALSALGQSLRLGKLFTGKLVEINLVMGIVNLALVVLAMVFSAAPLPFSDELGNGALHSISALAVVFYFVSTDYFQVVRLKGFIEFWKMCRGGELAR